VSTDSTTSALAGVAGFEPTTDGFGDRCSTGLSYTPSNIDYHYLIFKYPWGDSNARHAV
jgi:hypothetical protein